jgi:hypothetical protein
MIAIGRALSVGFCGRSRHAPAQESGFLPTILRVDGGGAQGGEKPVEARLGAAGGSRNPNSGIATAYVRTISVRTEVNQRTLATVEKKKSQAASELAKQRWKKVSKKERSQIARDLNRARWKKDKVEGSNP